MSFSVSTILKDLPSDPILALAEIGDRLGRLSITYTDSDFRLAVVLMQKFATKMGVALPMPEEGRPWSEDFAECRNFVATEITHLQAEVIENEVDAELDKLFAIRADEPGYAILSSDEKAEIAGKIEFIRQIIEGSGLDTKKKNVLFKKLNKFSAEVMKDGTDTDALFAFFGELSLTAGLMAENAKPALDDVKDILRIVFRNRAKREGLHLPSPEDVLNLPDFSND